MKNYAIPVAALLLIIAAGFQHRQQNRSEAQKAALLEQAAKSLGQAIPREFGSWIGVEIPIESRELRVAEIVGCVSRSYTHQFTGQSAQLVMVCGSPGPISVHTPDVCFAGNGYEMMTEPKRLQLGMPDGGTAEFWWADFRRPNVGPVPILRTFWSWRDQSTWMVVDHPRLEFAASPVLYKLYVAIPVITPDNALAGQPNAEFLRALLWNLDEVELNQPDQVSANAES